MPLPNDEYQKWADAITSQYPVTTDDLTVEIKNLKNITNYEKEKILELNRKFNMALYATSQNIDDEDISYVIELGKQLGLKNPDLVGYSPDGVLKTNRTMYSAPPLQNYDIPWHTDGYYNAISNHQIRSLLLHYAKPAEQGGEIYFMDTNIFYIYLRNNHPKLLEQFFNDDCATVIKKDSTVTGPVLAEIAPNQFHVRFSALPTFQWKPDFFLLKVVREIMQFLSDIDHNPFIVGGKLEKGAGVVCNNVLHYRKPYDNHSTRIIHRVRYYDRIPNT
jgi:hypothetical protein